MSFKMMSRLVPRNKIKCFTVFKWECDKPIQKREKEEEGVFQWIAGA